MCLDCLSGPLCGQRALSPRRNDGGLAGSGCTQHFLVFFFFFAIVCSPWRNGFPHSAGLDYSFSSEERYVFGAISSKMRPDGQRSYRLILSTPALWDCATQPRSIVEKPGISFFLNYGRPRATWLVVHKTLRFVEQR